ncbi:MAG TPA: TetR/AcrR family transcriptional regulator [Bacteroidia bacterium]|nr:TetR/AcrR family transcriptional regulator [Bacteroidia bacterium]MBP9922802.1 TetR/AcrR family transcriptional regulator [Bacteroidia bacterium]HQW22846.1 TetR/AcrR family transcriptional regulator [Bacteroidia bacterium]
MKLTSTEDRILNGARELFFKQGIRSITMDDIAEHLAISKKTIYTHYKDKDLIVKSMFHILIEQEHERMHQIRKISENPIDEIMRLMEHLGSFISQFNPAVFYDLQKFYPLVWAEFRVFREKEVMGFVEDNLRKGVKLELYRKEIKIKIIARLRIEMIYLGFDTDVFPINQYNHAQVQVALLDHFLHGIVTLKGNKMISKYTLNTK